MILPAYNGFIVFYVTFLIIATMIHLYARYSPMSQEVERKLMHISIGVCLLGLPWVLHSIWAALLLFSSIMFGPAIAKSMKWSKWLFGRICDVKRKNMGPFSLGIAFLVLFLLAEKYKIYYLISGLVVVFADAAAAIIGSKYEWFPFRVLGYKKTLSGCTAFFIVAMICVFIPLYFASGHGFLASLGSSAAIAAIAAVIEALSPFGLDNVSVPIGVFLSLRFLI